MYMTFSPTQQEAIYQQVAAYWSRLRRYEQAIARIRGHNAYQRYESDDFPDRFETDRFLDAVRPVLRQIYRTTGNQGLQFAARAVNQLRSYYALPSLDCDWWWWLLDIATSRNPRWRPSRSPKGNSRAIKLHVAPEHIKPLERLAEQYRQVRDATAQAYLVRRMFEVGGVAGVDYAAGVLAVPPETLYEHYPLHISRAIRSGRSGRNAHHKQPLGKRPIVQKPHWSWANRMLAEDTGEWETLGGKRDGHYARHSSNGSLHDRSVRQSVR